MTTSQLVLECYWLDRLLDKHYGHPVGRSWYRQNVRRAATALAAPIGYGKGRGRPILWALRNPVPDTPFRRVLQAMRARKLAAGQQ